MNRLWQRAASLVAFRASSAKYPAQTWAELGEQLRQLRDIRRDPPRLIFAEQLGGSFGTY
jgi:hypothetical protein